MNKKETLEHARFIFTTGKLIRDRIIRIQARHMVANGRNGQEEELSLSQLHTVHVLHDCGPVTVSQLAAALGVTPPSASTMVDRLVEKGLLSREPSREDRRKVLVSVSPEALKKIDAIEETILHSFVDLVEKIGPKTARMWCQVLKRVREVQEEEQSVNLPTSTSRPRR
jgi:DNA-binding MarR family transcriptional regulator